MTIFNPSRRGLIAGGAGAAAALTLPQFAQAQAKGDIKIAHVYSRTGPLEAYGKQTQTGLMMGLEYATNGTMAVNGKKLVVIEKDDQGKPDVGKSLLATAYGDDKADIAVGPSSSGVALALLPVTALFVVLGPAIGTVVFAHGRTEVVEARAGGGMVAVKMSGDLELRELRIDPEAVDPEDVDMLQDMVQAAINEAIRAAQELAAAKMNAAAGGLAGPGGLGGLGLPGF